MARYLGTTKNYVPLLTPIHNTLPELQAEQQHANKIAPEISMGALIGTLAAMEIKKIPSSAMAMTLGPQPRTAPRLIQAMRAEPSPVSHQQHQEDANSISEDASRNPSLPYAETTNGKGVRLVMERTSTRKNVQTLDLLTKVVLSVL